MLKEVVQRLTAHTWQCVVFKTGPSQCNQSLSPAQEVHTFSAHMLQPAATPGVQLR